MINNCLLFFKIAEKIAAVEEDCLKQNGLNIQRLRILFWLYTAERRTLPFAQIMDLDLLKCSQPTFSRLMDSLEVAGLIMVEKSEEDGRGKFAVLTDAGAEVCKNTENRLHEIEKMLVAGMSQEDIDTMLSKMKMIYENIEKIEL